MLDKSRATLQDDPDLARMATSEGTGFLGLLNGKTAERVCQDFLVEIYKYMLAQIKIQLTHETVLMSKFILQ